MIDRDFTLLLIGAGIALGSSLITAIVQHWLSLRADNVKRERDTKEPSKNNFGISGEVMGALKIDKVAGGEVQVDQEVDTISGKVTGAKINRLG